ncbi:NACHT domain-containing protein [Anabaena cylindrica FACHB-243]|uniref:(Myosin heavy-chain) kinase n=1 Tax=Anabaena cylindrica (strain ATCC 27899 / PCC 7122) TaxID=272123 RepID=K9ZQ57_ANACC|nr:MULTISPECIES: WD40 repeat domain-containing protein [Anabaena]AFZ61353.1 (Myosin heavy-chain) kinase [Anabaena cylindrica PCC 7122]MBD2421825.1 NACHT domain-containing protein [Anabaena cylindrica FACHB-243]MBY5281896.1 NACHT domain-containing protein [Anabaena sp. CCAP 1446/1C]MBY5306954.1 NACHT domain-containing protein [Anabaena sp. CCAP 1446/1C]MCM2405971.1 NB-ARC domain-containing protein [Anabaena sp. CCAP 1446/1C]
MADLLKASPKGLEILDQARRQRGWNKQNLSQYGVNTSDATLKRFWRRIPIDKEIFIKICEALGVNWQEIASHPIDWGDAPSVDNFFGRSKELDDLESWIIQKNCGLISILGIGGIGKSSLAVKLGQKVQGNFEYLIWRSFLNAPSFEDVLKSLIQFLSNQQETALKSSLDEQISQLIFYLGQKRCLLILDNIETVISNEKYDELFKKLAETNHQSCIILTSRVEPSNLRRLRGNLSSVRFYELLDLEVSAVRKIFSTISDEFETTRNSDAQWQKLVNIYAGNPFALRLTAIHMKEVYGSSIAQFVQAGVINHYDINELLDCYFDSSKPFAVNQQEEAIMYWLAINREPVSRATLQENTLEKINKNSLDTTIRSLKKRFLITKIEQDIEQNIEQDNVKFTLQPILIEYLTNKLIDKIYLEINNEPQQLNLFNQYALMQATSKDFVRDTQIKLIITPILTKIQHQPNPQQILLRILANIQNNPSLQQGYAAGNLLNFLSIFHQHQLHNYNFSGLTIRQAYLPETTLHDVNFSNCTFDKTVVFTESFGGIHSVAFSPDGKFLVMGDTQGKIQIINVENNQYQYCLNKQAHFPGMWITSIAFPFRQDIANSYQFITGSFDKTVKLWDLTTLLEEHDNQQTFTGHNGLIWIVAFSPDGKKIASGCDDNIIRVWDLESGKDEPYKLQGHQYWIWGLAFSPDSKILASGSFDKTIKLWNLENGDCTQTLESHQGWVVSLAFSPNGQILASGSFDKTIKLWKFNNDYNNYEYWETLEGHKNGVRVITFSPDGEILASGGVDQEIRIWNLETLECVRTLTGHSAWIRSLSFHADNKTLASGSDDQTVRIWNVKTGQSLRVFKGYLNWIWSVAVSTDRKQIATGSFDKTIKIWNLNQEESVVTLNKHKQWIWCVAFHPYLPLLASCSDDQTIIIWNLNNHQCLLNKIASDFGGIWSVTWSSDGHYLACGGQDGTVRIFEYQVDDSISYFEINHEYILNPRHEGWVWSVAFSPDNEILASASHDKKIILWRKNHENQRFELWQELLEESGISSVSFRPDSRNSSQIILASGHEDCKIRLRTINCVDNAIPIESKTLTADQGHQGWVFTVAFNPQNYDILASGGGDCKVKLWDLATNSVLWTQQHQGWVKSVTFSDDGEWVVSASTDGTTKIWNIEGKLIRELFTPRPYEGLNITNTQGLNPAQMLSLRNLGAITYLDGDAAMAALGGAVA